MAMPHSWHRRLNECTWWWRCIACACSFAGSWLPVFEIVSLLAVLTNSAIICFTSVQLPLLFPSMSKLMQFGIVVIFEVRWYSVGVGVFIVLLVD